MSKEIIAFSAELVSKGTQGQQFGGDRTSVSMYSLLPLLYSITTATVEVRFYLP